MGADTAGEYRALAAAGAVDGDARGRHNLVEGVDDAVRNPVRITPGETLDRRWRRSRRSPPWGQRLGDVPGMWDQWKMVEFEKRE